MIGSIAYSSSFLAYGGAGGAGYARDLGVYSNQPFDTRASALRALANGGSEIDRITAALTKLRDALQATRDQAGFSAGSTDLRAIVTTTGQGTSRDGLSAAGITYGDSFTVQVGSGSVATITFKNAKQIDLSVDGATQSFTFNASDGSWQTGLVNALNSIANVSAQLTSAGGLNLETTNGASLTIAAPSAVNDPLAELGLSAGTTYSGNAANALAEAGISQITLGALTAVVGYDRVNRQAIDTGDAVRTLVSATASLSASAGSDAAAALGTALSGLLQSSDFKAALSRTDPAAIDATLVRIDDALAKAESLRVPVSYNQSAAARIDLSGLLLDGSLQAASSSTAGASGSQYCSSSSGTTGSQLSSLA